MNEFSRVQFGSAGAANLDFTCGDIRASRFFRSVKTTRLSFYETHGKRALDLTVTLLVAPILIVLVGVFALAVWFQGGAPIYTQKRVGRGGRIFTIYKIRSMVRDADARLEAHLAADPKARREWNVHQKLKQDPRITGLGHFIRKTSIDELPQFLNVLTGDMSLIGPRPFMEDQRALYKGTAYYVMRPGLSGSWQVSERSESSFEERRTYDDQYFRDVSLGTDMRIFGKTFGVLANASGV